MEENRRYSVIETKNPREIVLLRGRGCFWKQCTFCDYHTDCAPDDAANEALNARVLARVTGRYDRLEVINSGSFAELPAQTQTAVLDTCRARHIDQLHIECHWRLRETLPALRAACQAAGITLHVKTGVETFDADYRERVLHKGIDETDPAVIAAPFDECCLLFGLSGQTVAGMARDIEIGLAYFDRVCVNIMCENTTAVKPDPAVIRAFTETLYPRWRDDARVDILMENTDFGVGE